MCQTCKRKCQMIFVEGLRNSHAHGPLYPLTLLQNHDHPSQDPSILIKHKDEQENKNKTKHFVWIVAIGIFFFISIKLTPVLCFSYKLFIILIDKGRHKPWLQILAIWKKMAIRSVKNVLTGKNQASMTAYMPCSIYIYIYIVT